MISAKYYTPATAWYAGSGLPKAQVLPIMVSLSGQGLCSEIHPMKIACVHQVCTCPALWIGMSGTFHTYTHNWFFPSTHHYRFQRWAVLFPMALYWGTAPESSLCLYHLVLLAHMSSCTSCMSLISESCLSSLVIDKLAYLYFHPSSLRSASIALPLILSPYR